ncbi:hypothetical protein K525DRAFT_275390 [Schizophyllum commune Loenen D]|nr:hypothetical protein K525DRAFT_275390 [Schizophyllum commune Loenen D]
MSQDGDGQGQGAGSTAPAGTTQPSGGADPGQTTPPRPPLAAEVLSKCDDIIERYRAGSVAKVRAYIELQKAIPADDEKVFEDALSAQMRAIDSVDRLRHGGGERGSATANGLLGQAQPPGADGDGPSGNPSESVGEDHARKRLRSPRLDADEDEDTVATPRKRTNPRLFAWTVGDEIDRAILHPVVVETNRQLENFSRDLKGAETDLHNSSSKPQYPLREWTSLLTGQAADFDRVINGIYTVNVSQRAVQRIGDLELSLGHVAPTKTVKDHSDWVIAWNAVRRATVFVFPHLKEDLDAYAEHILGFFSAFPGNSAYHLRVINYDRAVRIRIAERRNLRFTDFISFSDLQLMWIHGPIAALPQGEDGHVSAPRARLANGARRDPCRRWNAGNCPNTTASCRYAHVCRRCRSNRHTEAACSKTD